MEILIGIGIVIAGAGWFGYIFGYHRGHTDANNEWFQITLKRDEERRLDRLNSYVPSFSSTGDARHPAR